MMASPRTDVVKLNLGLSLKDMVVGYATQWGTSDGEAAKRLVALAAFDFTVAFVPLVLAVMQYAPGHSRFVFACRELHLVVVSHVKKTATHEQRLAAAKAYVENMISSRAAAAAARSKR